MVKLIAIPTREDMVDDHFGHCAYYTVVTLDEQNQVVKQERLMEKVLFATDELTGLIWAAALMRPSKSVQDSLLQAGS